MASGKPDYWQTTYTGLPYPVSGQYMVFEYGNGYIDAGDNDSIVEYTVPDDRILYVTNIHITGSCLGIIWANFRIDGVPFDGARFLHTLILPLNSSSVYEVLGGQTIDLQIYNTDVFRKLFIAAIMGFEITV